VKRVFLEWPYDALWPNSRPHWAVKAKATKGYRFAAKVKCLGAEPGIIRVTFCPKPKGPIPDKDNCIAAFKAGQDGIADALKINDRDLIFIHEMGGRCKDGGVIVDFLPPEKNVELRGQIS
jgi:crossover junction endodeoxyribonuclease RusA